MKEYIIKEDVEGIRLNKFIKKMLPYINDALIYKFIRKKIIKVNDKKTEASYKLVLHDKVNIYLSDDTFNVFLNSNIVNDKLETVDKLIDAKNVMHKFTYDDIKKNIVYEDENIIIFNKPINMLSQSNGKIDGDNDISVNDLLNDYLNKKKDDEKKDDEKKLNEIDELFFNPTVVNRLDRNTKGLIIFAKNYMSAREISDMIKRNDIRKYYMAEVNGIMEKDTDVLINRYVKDEKKNIAKIYDIDISEMKKNDSDTLKKDWVKLEYHVIERKVKTTIVYIRLYTGKSHQIRAQLSHIGHPIVGDKKYMRKELYEINKKVDKKHFQELTCVKIIFGTFSHENLKYLNNKCFEIAI